MDEPFPTDERCQDLTAPSFGNGVMPPCPHWSWTPKFPGALAQVARYVFYRGYDSSETPLSTPVIGPRFLLALRLSNEEGYITKAASPSFPFMGWSDLAQLAPATVELVLLEG